MGASHATHCRRAKSALVDAFFTTKFWQRTWWTFGHPLLDHALELCLEVLDLGVPLDLMPGRYRRLTEFPSPTLKAASREPLTVLIVTSIAVIVNGSAMSTRRRTKHCADQFRAD